MNNSSLTLWTWNTLTTLSTSVTRKTLHHANFVEKKFTIENILVNRKHQQRHHNWKMGAAQKIIYYNPTRHVQDIPIHRHHHDNLSHLAHQFLLYDLYAKQYALSFIFIVTIYLWFHQNQPFHPVHLCDLEDLDNHLDQEYPWIKRKKYIDLFFFIQSIDYIWASEAISTRFAG